MKVITDKQAETYRQAGIWGDATLDSLFAATAAAHPNRVAMVDSPDRPDWTGGTPRSLTYAEADREIDRLAAFYGAVGMQPDFVLGIQSPNTVDTVLALLGALRAGLIVSPLPLHWRQKNVLSALNSIGAKGFIAADRVETRMMAHAARDVAGELFSLRFVFGLGHELPDGLVELGPMLEEMGNDLPPLPQPRDEASDHIATISWSRSSKDTVAVTRSHNHWMAAAQMIMSETGLKEGASVLVPYALSGLTGLGGGLAPWLMCGGTLHLHHPTSLPGLARHANSVSADYILAPGPLGQILDRGVASKDAVIVAAWNIAAPLPGRFTPRHPLIDLHIADEYALVAKKRTHEEVEAVPVGKPLGPDGCQPGAALLEIGLKDGITANYPGTLLVKGAVVPGTDWPTIPEHKRVKKDAEGFLETGIMVLTHDDGLLGFGIPGVYAQGVGDLEQVDEAYKGFPGLREAAAFLVEDEVLGSRIFAALVPSSGTVPDARAFYSYLDAQGVDLAAIPHRVLVLQSLPRLEDGSVDRERLTLRTQRMSAQVA